MPSPLDLSGASDQEIVALALADREEGYRELVARYSLRMHQLVRSIVGPSDRTVDLTQIAFAKAFTALDTYKPELPFKPWIMRIAHNVAVDYVRMRPFDSPSHPLAVTPSHIDAVDWLGPDDTPTTDPDLPDHSRMLKEALMLLRPQYRRCLKLQLVEGLSHREIAKAMRLPVGTVKSHLHRAKLELIEILRTDFDLSGPHKAHTPA